MISHSIRKFGTTAYKAAEVASRVHSANPYGVRVSMAQRSVDGFVGGILTQLMSLLSLRRDRSNYYGSYW